MGFFDNQERARRKTGLLVLLFLAAVLLITLAVNGAFWLILTVQGNTTLGFPVWLGSPQSLICAAVVVTLIAVGSLTRHAALRRGGEAVAKMAGARRVPLKSDDPLERRFRNVVEEMAIASGVVMPELFVMDREGAINAFVAGYHPDQAVMVVTRGALENLTRDELQGVVAHEFSHLLNGDMRLNVRLVSILAGILLLGQIGSFLMRSLGRYRARGRDGRAAGALVLIGLALTVIGYIGLFFGRLIKAAVSRQREYLADASAVQFTRQHEGIGGALYKIGLASNGSQLRHTLHAEELNHMCVGESIAQSFGGLFASHPPVNARLDAIDSQLRPRLQARYGRDGGRIAPASVSDPLAEVTTGFSTGSSGAPLRPLGKGRLAAAVGTVTADNEAYAQRLLATLPPMLTNAMHTTEQAVQICYALVLAADELPIADWGANKLTRPEKLTIGMLQRELEQLGAAYRLPCLEVAIAALRPLDADEKELLLSNIETLVRSDGRVSLSEGVVLGFLRKHLKPEGARAGKASFRNYGAVAMELRQLVSVMTVMGAGDQAERKALYTRTLASFFSTGETGSDMPKPRTSDLYRSLKKLSRLSPLLKPAIIDACGDCVIHDGAVSVREYELMRLIADQLDCPLPPLPTPF